MGSHRSSNERRSGGQHECVHVGGGRCSVEHQGPVAKCQQALHTMHEGQLVRGHQQRRAAGRDFVEQLEQGVLAGLIEPDEGLVDQHHLEGAHHRDGDGRLLPQATAMMGVPTFYTRLLADPRLTRDRVANVRLFVSGSAPLLAETHRQWQDHTGQIILERYGMTETNMNTSNPYAGDRRAGTVGPALPGIEVRVCDATGTEVPRGEVGVIEVRGPNVFQGYWQLPEKTREELRDNGFFITGDLAVMAPDGYVTIVGRAKDLVISGGFNVYPKEVEEHLDALPGVLESAVIGVPHPDFGEAVVAVVVPQHGATLDPAELAAALAHDLAKFKQPKHIAIGADLPRNTMGKVQKNLLRNNYKSLFA